MLNLRQKVTVRLIETRVVFELLSLPLKHLANLRLIETRVVFE